MARKDLIKKIEQRRRALSYKELEDQQFRAECDHKYEEKGRTFTALKETKKKGVFVCKICGRKLDTTLIDQDKLTEACDVVMQALECVKASDNDFDSSVISQLGSLSLAVSKVPSIYKYNYVDKIEIEREEDINDFDLNENGALYLNGNGSSFGDFGNRNNYYKKHKNKNKNKKHKNKDNDKRRGTSYYDLIHSN